MRRYPTPRSAERHPNGFFVIVRHRGVPERSLRPGLVGSAVLVAAVLASTAPSALPAAAAPTSMGPGAAVSAPGMIFVANAGSAGQGTGNGSVTGYRPSATGNARPVVLITAGINGPHSLTFDRSGDLWVVNGNNAVVEYSRAELTKASPSPTVTISSPAPNGVGFDASGDMWVVDINANSLANSWLVEFTRAQLAKSGDPKPVVTIGNPNLCSPVFDRSGDLWTGSPGSTVFEFTKAQLAKSSSPAPRVTISSGSSDSLGSPCRPEFDSSGDMWVANYNLGTVVEFTKAQLAKSGSPIPWVTLSSEDLSEPGDIAVDASGDLWVPNAGTTTLLEFTKSELAKSGPQAPAKTIAGPATAMNNPWAVAIQP
jgi:hypothetical protein